MTKKEKIYKITDCRRKYGQSTSLFLASCAVWFGTIFTENRWDQLGAYAVLATSKILSIKYEERMKKSIEVKRFQNIYKAILAKYIDLNKEYDFKTVLEIFALYNFTLNNDIFSITKEHEMVTSRRFDQMLIRELSLNHHGVCRHVSTMLVDVYKELGIQSEIGVCLRPEIIQVIEPLTEEDEEMLKVIQNELNSMIQMEINGKRLMPEDFKIAKPVIITEKEKTYTEQEKARGNHAITLATDEEYTYYLDALNSNIFASTKNENELMSEDDITIKMIPDRSSIINHKYNIETGELKSTPTIDYMIERLSKAEHRIRTNIDLIRDYQKEIKEELEEAQELHRLILK